MPESRTKPIRALIETTDSGYEHAPYTPVDREDAVSRHMMSYVVEGYALYAAALYPPLFHDVSSAEIFSRYSSDRTYGPGWAANDVGVNDNLRALPPLACDEATQTPSSYGLTAAIKAAAQRLQRLWRHIREERETARAISLLANLDDRTLQDIGLHRSQIAHVARYGLDQSDRVRSPGS